MSIYTQNVLAKQDVRALQHKGAKQKIRQAGLTLVELMIAMGLGIFLVGGILSIYTSTQQNFRVSQNVSRLQEGARFSFEQIGRDVRDAGANLCGVKAVSNVVRIDGASPDWANWDAGTLVGYESGTSLGSITVGTSVGDRATGTDAISMLRASMDDADLKVIQSHTPAANTLVLDNVDGYAAEDVVLMCDAQSGAIAALSTISKTAKSIEHGLSSFNCTNKLGWPQPSNCSGTGNKTFSSGGFVSKLDPGIWYVGIGSNNSRSLYRMKLTKKTISGTATPTLERQEMVPDVHDMQIQYLTRDRNATANALATSWVDADDNKFNAAAKAWTIENINEVVAVKVTLTFKSPETVGSDGKALERSTTAVFSLRNREIKP
jgi:type IV pilus assembly protein PilW